MREEFEMWAGPRWPPVWSCLKKMGRFSDLSCNRQGGLGKGRRKVAENGYIFVWFLKWLLLEIWGDKIAKNGTKRQKNAKMATWLPHVSKSIHFGGCTEIYLFSVIFFCFFRPTLVIVRQV